MEGILLTKQALRYTPAGVPVIEIAIKHTSIQMDGKKPRSVELEIDAQGFGDMAMRLSALSEGEAVSLRGFLAKRTQRSSRLVLHVNELVNQTTSD